MTTDKEFLLNVSVPKETATYKPLSHGNLINAIQEQLDKCNLVIKDERFSQNRSGHQMFGNFTIAGMNGEQDMNVGFRNSYDKSLQIGVVSGSRVIVCSNLMFKGDFKAVMMHNSSMATELEKKIKESIDNLERNYLMIQKDSDKLKMVKVHKQLISEVLGDLFYHEEIVTLTQLGIIKDQLKLAQAAATGGEPTNFGTETLWDIYNHTTEALKTTPSGLVIPRHIDTHEYFMSKA